MLETRKQRLSPGTAAWRRAEEAACGSSSCFFTLNDPPSCFLPSTLGSLRNRPQVNFLQGRVSHPISNLMIRFHLSLIRARIWSKFKNRFRGFRLDLRKPPPVLNDGARGVQGGRAVGCCEQPQRRRGEEVARQGRGCDVHCPGWLGEERGVGQGRALHPPPRRLRWRPRCEMPIQDLHIIVPSLTVQQQAARSTSSPAGPPFRAQEDVLQTGIFLSLVRYLLVC